MIPGMSEAWFARRDLPPDLWEEFAPLGRITTGEPQGVHLVRAQAQRLEGLLLTVERQPCSTCGGGVDPAQVHASIEAQEALVREGLV